MPRSESLQDHFEQIPFLLSALNPDYHHFQKIKIGRSLYLQIVLTHRTPDLQIYFQIKIFHFGIKPNATLPLSERIFPQNKTFEQCGNDNPPWTHQHPKTILKLATYLKNYTKYLNTQLTFYKICRKPS